MTTITPTTTAAVSSTGSADHLTLGLAVGAPLLWGATLLLHPVGDPEQVLNVVGDNLSAWQGVHLAMVAFIPLFALGVHRLLRGITSAPARIARLALPVFAVVYGVFEALMGLGTGMLVDSSEGIDPIAREAVVEAYIDSALLANIETIASLVCGVAIVAAAFALRRSQRIGRGHVIALLVAAPGIAVHAPPFGPIGLALFALVAYSSVRSTSSAASGSAEPFRAADRTAHDCAAPLSRDLRVRR